MIVTTYCTAQSLILQLISSGELLVLLWVSVIEVTVGAGGGPIIDYAGKLLQKIAYHKWSIKIIYPSTLHKYYHRWKSA